MELAAIRSRITRGKCINLQIRLQIALTANLQILSLLEHSRSEDNAVQFQVQQVRRFALSRIIVSEFSIAF